MPVKLFAGALSLSPNPFHLLGRARGPSHTAQSPPLTLQCPTNACIHGKSIAIYKSKTQVKTGWVRVGTHLITNFFVILGWARVLVCGYCGVLGEVGSMNRFGIAGIILYISTNNN